jgi:hypothetical protein
MTMDDISLNLIVLTVLALIGGLIFFLVRQNHAENEQKIIQLATEHGWEYESIREPLAWGMRLKTAQWTLEAISRSSGKEAGPGSSDVAMSTTWRSNTSGSTFLIGARSSQANLGGFGDMLTRQVLQLALGAQADGLVEIQAGSEAFLQKYMLWARDPAEMERLVTPELESILLAWKGQPPYIKRLNGNLVIELRAVRLQKGDDLCRLVMLGELFL